MTVSPHVEWEDPMLQTDSLDSAIRRVLAQVGTCTADELNERLSHYSWIQVFSAVDHLSREGVVTLQRNGPLDYVLSLKPPGEAGHMMSV